VSNPSPFDPEKETRYVEKHGIFEPITTGPGKVECFILIWSILSSILLLIEILLFDSSDGLLCIGILLCVIIGLKEHNSSAACGEGWNWIVLFVGVMMINGIITKLCDISYWGLLLVYLCTAGVIVWRHSEQKESKE
jgi:hypothetical protein